MGIVKEWDVAKGTLVRDLDASVLHKYDNTFAADIGGVRSMAFDRDGKLLSCAGITEVSNAFAGVGKPLVVLFDWASGKRKQSLVPKEAFQGTAWGVAFHPSGFVIGAGAGNGGAIWFWKPEGAQAFFTLKLPQNARDLDLHPDGKQLAVAGADGVLRVYEMLAKK
jgi:WD40 repeat protein